MHRSMSQQRDISDRRRPLTDYRAELKSPYCRPAANQYDQDKRMRREIANSNERRRMQSINNGFTVLRKKLPSQHQEEKLSKANILQQTSEYITKLEDEVRVLSNQVKHYAFRQSDSLSSRKRKNLDRNGGLREDDLLNAMQDEKLQLQCRLEEEMDRNRELTRRVTELEKSAAAHNKVPSSGSAVEFRAVSGTPKPPTQKMQHPAKQVPHRIATASSIIGISATPTTPAAANVTTSKASSGISSSPPASGAQNAVADKVITTQGATIVRVKESPEPPAKRAAPYHGLHQLILAADHVENERHQVRAISRVDPKLVTTSGSHIMVKTDSSEQAGTGTTGTGKSLQHLQLVQLVTANSQSESSSVNTAATSTTSSSTAVTNVSTTVSSSPPQQTSSVSSSGATSQLIHIVPAGQDITSASHVLHLVTGSNARNRSAKVNAAHDQKQSQQPQQENREQPTAQQVLRIVPQVRLQTTGSSTTKSENSSSNVLEQLTSKLNVTADIGPQFTLVMRRPASSSAQTTPPQSGSQSTVQESPQPSSPPMAEPRRLSQPVTPPIVKQTVETAVPNPIVASVESLSPTSQSVTIQCLDQPNS